MRYYIPSRLMITALFIGLGILLFALSPASAQNSSVELTAFPSDLQLYPRDLQTNRADVSVTGTNGTGNPITLNVYRNDALWQTETVTPTMLAEPFTVTTTIFAGLDLYDFELLTTSASGETSVTFSAADVVAGDVYLINGGSNAEASMIQSGESGMADQSTFVRSFGSSSTDGRLVTNNHNWFVAQSDCLAGDGCVGQWGVRFGNNIIAEQSVPVALLNGAVGSRGITTFLRNDGNVRDATTNFGRLHWRAEEANLVDDVRAILWYGEETPTDDQAYIDGLNALYTDWRAQYPSLERVYIHQARTDGCNTPVSRAIAQRDFAQDNGDVTIIATNGLDGHTGCYYAYAEGYQQMGDNLSRAVRHDLYNAPIRDAQSPDVIATEVLDSTTLIVFFTAGNTIIADNGFEQLFVLKNETTGETYRFDDGVISLEYDNGAVIISNTPILEAGDFTLSYIGGSHQQPWVTNAAGMGILTFDDIPITYLDNLTPVSGSIEGQLWHDLNADGADSADPILDEPFPSTIVRLEANSGSVVEASTDSEGFYRFTNLPLDETYTVIVNTATLPVVKRRLSPTYDPDGVRDGRYTVQLTQEESTVFNANFSYVTGDYGDLPNSYGTAGDNPPFHAIVLDGSQLVLGGGISAEENGQPNPEAMADLDNGVEFQGVFRAGDTLPFNVTVLSGQVSDDGAYLGIWIDWNHNGTFSEDEFIPYTVQEGLNILFATAPEDYVEADLAVRFRLFAPRTFVLGTAGAIETVGPVGTVGVLGTIGDLRDFVLDWTDFEGAAVNGEVEDYIFLAPSAITLQQIWTSNNQWLIFGAFILLLLVNLNLTFHAGQEE